MKYPIGIQNFEKIREGGYVYVDKTGLMHKLVRDGQFYFLSRPRRFGKSLLISTLEAYFEGKKELFEGLAISGIETEWIKYPVLHLDLNARNYQNGDSLIGILNQNLEVWESRYGNDKRDRVPEERFMYIIKRAFEQTGRPVVILIDEYDKPMLQAIGNSGLQDEYRNTLKAFYGALKSMDRYIKFALLTGVTKFGKVSVFSDLNNLRDISMLKDYESLCGITEEELYSNFREQIMSLGNALGLSEDDAKARLKSMYDGYHFNEDCVDIYNPFSLLNTFASNKIGSYWFETGTPTYLVELLKLNDFNIGELDGIEIDGMMLESIDTTSANPIPVLYQSGYLTIKDYDREFNTYVLGYPNMEVEYGFVNFLLPFYGSLKNDNSGFEIKNFVKDVRSGNIDSFMSRLSTFFSDTSYEMSHNLEVHYQNIIYIVFKLMGFYTEVEYRTSSGRIDMLVKTSDYIYVMEFKLDGTAEEALRQINDRHYAAPFEHDGRKILKVGVNFSNAIRGIEKWVVED